MSQWVAKHLPCEEATMEAREVEKEMNKYNQGVRDHWVYKEAAWLQN